jgi:hypothetical protein
MKKSLISFLILMGIGLPFLTMSACACDISREEIIRQISVLQKQILILQEMLIIRQRPVKVVPISPPMPEETKPTEVQPPPAPEPSAPVVVPAPEPAPVPVKKPWPVKTVRTNGGA